MIKEDYVSFEIAKLLKEKGFDIPVRFEYHCIYNVNQKPQFHKKPHNFNGVEYSGLTSKWYSAPTHQMAMKWLREVHHKIIIIHYGNVGHPDEPKLQWHWELLNIKGEFCECNISDGNETYEDACEAAIKYCLENLK